MQLIERLSSEADKAEEPVLYSTAAYAAIKRDDFGSPKDRWERTKSFQAAIGRWQKVSKKLHQDEIGLFKAQLLIVASRPDLAWNELVLVTREDGGRTEAVLTLLIKIALESGDG